MNDIFNCYYKKYDAWYDKNRFAYLSEIETIKKVLPKKGRGLEIGVGTGRFAAPLGITTGIDPSENMLGVAKEKGINVHLGFGEHLPFKNAAFDYVMIVITLCFVQNPEKVLKESRRVLRKGGNIIVGIVDKNSFLGKFYQKKKSIFYKQANFFSVKEVAGLLKITGFNRFSYYQAVFQLPDRMNSIENPQKGFKKGGFVVIKAGKAAG
ncbi:MAG: methyltransferase domain-containing protein [Candidatus Omnitrophota bacterium]|nr:methyltransferase domain-containing protein [Candidatus Omnitrophota bacterium]